MTSVHVLYPMSPTHFTLLGKSFKLRPVPSILQIDREIFAWDCFDSNNCDNKEKVGIYNMSESWGFVKQTILRTEDGGFEVTTLDLHGGGMFPGGKPEKTTLRFKTLEEFKTWIFNDNKERHLESILLPEDISVPLSTSELVDCLGKTDFVKFRG